MMDFIRNSNNIKFPGEDELISEDQTQVVSSDATQESVDVPETTEEPKTDNESGTVEDQNK
jgi:hypothetical protein